MEIYFVFSPTRKRKKETPPTLHTLSKPHEPTLKPKLCQRVQFLPAFKKFIIHLQNNKLGVPNFKAEIIPSIPDQDNACVGK